LSKNINKKRKEAQFKNAPISEKPIVNDRPIDEMADVNSLQEFIELTKLQNNVLRKMLENIHVSENPK
jgi:hypothetical protein